MLRSSIVLLCLLLAACGQVAVPPAGSAQDPAGSSDPAVGSDLSAQGRKVQPQPLPASCPTATTAEPAIRAVRFDPSYYYGLGMDARTLSTQLAAQWQQNGVNTVYFQAYNPTYGARYLTGYANTSMEDWGRQDLLGELLKAAGAKGIRVVAWLYDYRHGGAIAAHPGWASRRADGSPYGLGADTAFLSLGSADTESWYQGFVQDLLTRYPALDGVDLAEPVVNWWGTEADYSASMTAAFQSASPGRLLGGSDWRTFRAQRLTAHLLRTVQTIHALCKKVHLTMTLPADASGNLMSSATLASETGFDLNAVLSGADRPDVFNAELIWQQWKSEYGGSVFTPTWTGAATVQARALVAGRAKLVVHVEATDFGSGPVTPAQVQQSLTQASAAGADGLDVYHTRELDLLSAWPAIASAYLPAPAPVASAGIIPPQ